jgi:hypothetical protein
LASRPATPSPGDSRFRHRNWSAKAEYDYISFGDRKLTASDGSLLNVGMHVSVKVGVNYRFGGGAVRATIPLQDLR